jgi:hypothetical protein
MFAAFLNFHMHMAYLLDFKILLETKIDLLASNSTIYSTVKLAKHQQKHNNSQIPGHPQQRPSPASGMES